jgi:hypothetical protein
VEEQLNWFKSSYSGQPSTDCVEAAILANQNVAVRDSKKPDGPRHTFRRGSWTDFIQALKQGGLQTPSA